MSQIIALEMTSDFCPSQWEGKLDTGKEILAIYIRYRWGCLRWGSGRDLDGAIDDSDNNWKEIGDKFDGTMTTEEMLKHIPWKIRSEKLLEEKQKID